MASFSLDIEEVDQVSKYLHQHKGITALLASLKIDTITQTEFEGATWLLRDTLANLEEAINKITQAEKKAA